jgi:hypothetical protein
VSAAAAEVQSRQSSCCGASAAITPSVLPSSFAPPLLPPQAPGQRWAHRSEITALDAAVLSEDPSVPPVLFSGE